MVSIHSFLTAGIFTLTLFAMSPKLHATPILDCEVLFRPVKNVGAKTDLQSHLDSIEERLSAEGIAVSDLTLSIRHGNRARVTISHGETQIAYGFLRPPEQSVHVGRVSIENILVNFNYVSRGIGTLTYLLLAREAHRQGHLLESSWDLSDEALGVWSGLVKRGWAKKIDYLFSEFDPDFIASPETLAALDQFTGRFKHP